MFRKGVLHYSNADGEKVDYGQNIYDCMSRNVVCSIRCTRYSNIVYVGETSRKIKERMKLHDADVRLRRYKAVGDHFNSHGHSRSDMEVVILERIVFESRYFRQI